MAIGADVADEAAVARLFAEAAAALGGLDLLVVNSSIQKDAPAGEMTLDDWRGVLDVNLTGQFLCCREAIRTFRAGARWGEVGRGRRGRWGRSCAWARCTR